MPPTFSKEKAAYSASAPGKSSPTGPSVFVFPERASRSGGSSPRYGKQKTSDSSSTSSWASQGESPLRYGRQKTPDSANASPWFSEEDSSYSPFSPSFEHHVDSATLFGDKEFKSPCSAPKPSCPLKGKVEPQESPRPPLPPNKKPKPGGITRPKRAPLVPDYSEFLPFMAHPGAINQWGGFKLPMHGPTPKRETLSPSQLSPISDYSDTSLDSSSPHSPEYDRQLLYPSSDNADILTPPTPHAYPSRIQTVTPEFGDDRKRRVLSLSPAQLFPSRREHVTPEFGDDRRRRVLSLSPAQLSPLSDESSDTSLGSSSPRHSSDFSPHDASSAPRSPASRLVSPLPASSPQVESQRRKLGFPGAFHEISTPPTPGTTPSTQEPVRSGSGDVTESGSRRRVPYMSPSQLFDATSYREVQSDRSIPPLNSQNKDISTCSPRLRRIKAPCCNLADEFSLRELETHSPKYSPTYFPDKLNEPSRTLTAGTFNSYINSHDLVAVMFHNSTTNKPGTEIAWTTHSLKSSRGANQVFASVDCAKEASLCAREDISTIPFYKLYSGGSTLNAARDLEDLWHFS